MTMLAPNPLPTLAQEILSLLPDHSQGITIAEIAHCLGAGIASVRAAARELNADGRAVLMRRIDSREHFLVSPKEVTRQKVPTGLRCCVQCGKAFEIAKWYCPKKRGQRFAYSPARTCSQKCAALLARRDGKRCITPDQVSRCVSLRLEHNLSAPAIAARVGISNHSAYRILRDCPPWIPTKRRPVRAAEWTEEQDAIVRRMYPRADEDDIARELPSHTWTAIERRASFLKVRRRRNEARHHDRRVHPLIADLLSFREQAGIARTALSRRCGIHVNQLLGWELGKAMPRLDDVATWAASLGLQLMICEASQ